MKALFYIELEVNVVVGCCESNTDAGGVPGGRGAVCVLGYHMLLLTRRKINRTVLKQDSAQKILNVTNKLILKNSVRSVSLNCFGKISFRCDVLETNK